MADRINFTICKHPILGAIFPMLQESAHLFEADFLRLGRKLFLDEFQSIELATL